MAAIPPAAGPALWFALPEPWGALAGFYLFQVFGAFVGASRSRPGSAGPAAFRFGAAFSIPGAVLPFSLVPADGLGLVLSTAAAWGLALGAGAALGALLSAPRLARPGSRLRVAARWGTAFLVGGAAGGAAADLLVTALPPRGYIAAWAIGVVGAAAMAGGALERSRLNG